MAAYSSRVARRLDTSSLRADARKRTPQGGLRVDATLTRTGIFLYRGEDGRDVREYRSPEEVFKADSLATLRLAPLVIGHPDMVRPGNYRAHNVGVVGEDVRADGKFVAAGVVVQDQQTIENVETGNLCELSCGYEVDLVHEPGVTPDGEHYDAVQRNIRYNHVGLLPPGAGRAGSEVRLRLDSNGDVITPYPADMLTAEQEKARADKAEGERDALKSEADRLRAECAQLKTDAANAKSEADKARTDALASVPALVSARAALESNARKILGVDAALTVKADGKDRPMTDEEIVVAVIAKDEPSFKVDGRESTYLRARFDMVCERVQRSDAAHVQVALATTDAAVTGAGQTKSRLDTAYEQAEADRKKANQSGPPAGAMVKS